MFGGEMAPFYPSHGKKRRDPGTYHSAFEVFRRGKVKGEAKTYHPIIEQTCSSLSYPMDLVSCLV
jgi:hypothetical protein